MSFFYEAGCSPYAQPLLVASYDKQGILWTNSKPRPTGGKQSHILVKLSIKRHLNEQPIFTKNIYIYFTIGKYAIVNEIILGFSKYIRNSLNNFD